MSNQTVSLQGFETELKNHRFSFTIPATNEAEFAKSIQTERYLLRTASSAGREYLLMYRRYMDNALRSHTGFAPRAEQRNAQFPRRPTARLDVHLQQTDRWTVDAYREALKEFNWNWAHTCSRATFEQGKARQVELKSVADRHGGDFKRAWTDALQMFQASLRPGHRPRAAAY